SRAKSLSSKFSNNGGSLNSDWVEFSVQWTDLGVYADTLVQWAGGSELLRFKLYFRAGFKLSNCGDQSLPEVFTDKYKLPEYTTIPKLISMI
ncbi:hypothetical protein Tco_1434117, partial [Tanacetum coccineum]